jgi:glucosamine-phosphate N-acetyltransferase
MNYIIRHIQSNDFYKKYLYLLSELSPITSSHYSIFNKYINSIICNNSHFIFVIEDNNIIIGTITVLFEQKISHNFKKVAHIEDLVVKKGFRNLGIAKKLLDYCINFSKKNNCYKIILNCKYDLIPFYKKLGFNNNNQQMSIYFE